MANALVARKLLPLLIFLACGDVLAYSAKATDDAFAALLSMPGSEPARGQWNTPELQDFSPGLEPALIAFLAKKQKAGADFNAYRHQGTLLHHAIRAGKTKAAIWLLEHGADPKKKVIDTADDALAVSLAYKRASLASLLTQKYGLTPPPTKAAPGPIPEPRMASPTDVDGARVMLARAAWLSEQVNAIGAGPEDSARYRKMLANWNSATASMAPEVYAKAMDDDTAMANLVILDKLSATDLEQALARIPAPIGRQHAKAAVAALASKSHAHIDSKSSAITYDLPAAVWLTLWRRLGQPLDYGDRAALAGDLQPELWPGLLASGYPAKRSERALGCILNDIGARDLKAMWPRLTENFPDIRDAAPGMVLASYRLQGRIHCYGVDSASTRDKLSFLFSSGVKGPVKGLVKQELEGTDAGLRAAVVRFLPAVAATPPRLVDAAPTCTFSLTEAWFRKLLETSFTVSNGTGDIYTVQLLDIPGEAERGLLVGGYLDHGDLSQGIADSFTGPEFISIPSCLGPQDLNVVWQNRQGKIVELRTDMGGDDGSALLVPVRDTATGQRYYLNDGVQNGRCNSGRRLPFTFEWRQSGQDWALMRTDPDKHEKALYDQCRDDGNGGVQCRGIAAIGSDRPEEKSPSGFRDTPRAEFVKKFAQGRYKDYLQAVAALDKPTLQKMREAGLPGEWTADAILQVSASSAPLAAKRARTAWIFADRAQLERAVDFNVLEALLAWLPREDWRPVLDVIAKRPQHYRLLLAGTVAEKKRDDLTCDLDNAYGLVCGEILTND